MTVLMVPEFDPANAWPTLGFQLADWMEDWLVFGPGDVRGEPYRLDDEKRAVLARMYEVHPLPETKGKRAAVLRRFEAGERWQRGMPLSGRRRFKRTGVSVRKGWAKTELAAAVTAGELHPDAPVRCIGWTLERGEYVPVGGGVKDPYVPMVAYTDEQSEELAYGALCVMLAEGPLAEDFDVGVERVAVIGPSGRIAGKAVHLAAAPDSRDGARTTFQVFDETHRQDSDRLKHAHETMLANVPKRLEADAHTLEVTTSYEPGKESVAEGTHEYARLVAEGKVEDQLLFYYHREAGPHHKLKDEKGRLDRAAMEAAVLEASGPAAEFTDVDYIVSLGLDPQVDLAYWERVWLNRVKASGAQFFDVMRWDELEHEYEYRPPKGALVTLGFDGSRSGDSTGIVGTEVETGRQFRVALWEHPLNADGSPIEGWEVPEEEVDAALDEAFRRWDVVFLYADPYWWEDHVAAWQGRYGTRRVGKRRLQRVVAWHTNRPKQMANALRAYRNAMRTGELSHDGDPVMRSHLANARKRDVNFYDEDGQPLAVIGKERRDSPHKIDLAMCGCLSWEARRDAVALGVKRQTKTLVAY